MKLKTLLEQHLSLSCIHIWSVSVTVTFSGDSQYCQNIVI
jgi:hypothetical protein